MDVKWPSLQKYIESQKKYDIYPEIKTLQNVTSYFPKNWRM